MVEKKLAWYEAKIIKDMMALMGGRALRGAMSTYISSKVYQGKASLLRVANLLEATIDKEERRALIITDSFTQKFTKYVTDYLDLFDKQLSTLPPQLKELTAIKTLNL